VAGRNSFSAAPNRRIHFCARAAFFGGVRFRGIFADGFLCVFIFFQKCPKNGMELGADLSFLGQFA
jgi:hypothetical protein